MCRLLYADPSLYTVAVLSYVRLHDVNQRNHPEALLVFIVNCLLLFMQQISTLLYDRRKDIPAIMEATSKPARTQQKKGNRQWLIASLGEPSTHVGSDDTSTTPIAMYENITHFGEGPEHVADLHERLIGSNIHCTADGEIPLLETSKPVLEVVAPADLPEGYEFDVAVGSNGGLYQVQVPRGGVEKGQIISVPMPEQCKGRLIGFHIPVGHWRDGLFDCFKYGVCHAHCWMSWMCTFLATGQVIRRMQFSWNGTPTERSEGRSLAFPLIIGIVVVYFILHVAMLSILTALDPNHGKGYNDPGYQDIPPPRAIYMWIFLYRIWSVAYWVLSTVILIRTRRNVRQRYGIPVPYELQDCCCAVWCHCCVAAQMLRHTTDYDIYPNYLCTETRLPTHEPVIL